MTQPSKCEWLLQTSCSLSCKSAYLQHRSYVVCVYTQLFCLSSAQTQADTHLYTADPLGSAAALVSVIRIAATFCSNTCTGLLVTNQDWAYDPAKREAALDSHNICGTDCGLKSDIARQSMCQAFTSCVKMSSQMLPNNMLGLDMPGRKTCCV